MELPAEILYIYNVKVKRFYVLKVRILESLILKFKLVKKAFSVMCKEKNYKCICARLYYTLELFHFE